MDRDREFTAAEIQHMRMAGIPADRPGLGGEYPRMMYRKTDKEHRVIQTDGSAKCGETWLVQNRFDGLLCDTQVANTVDEAEAMALEGWEISPKAAHGEADGMIASVSAKDAEIAALKAQLANGKDDEPAKRGPGRPRLSVDTDAE